ncbi:hypothetical protein CU098_004720, partial [Rhizopus stolonifer]
EYPVQTRRILPSIPSNAEREEKARQRMELNNQFKAYLEGLPSLTYPDYYQVNVVSDVNETNERIHALLEANKQDTSFGVDLEWPPQFVKGKPENKITLVQICSANEILLIQLARMHTFPIELRRFFEEKTVLKSGVNINADGLKLMRDFGFFTNGLVELKEMSEGYVNWSHNLRSLRALTGIFLGQNMSKGKVRMSNWAKAKLTDKQIQYAALDAYASYQIFAKLRHLRGSKPFAVKHMVAEKKFANELKSHISIEETFQQKKKGHGLPFSTTTLIRPKSPIK